MQRYGKAAKRQISAVCLAISSVAVNNGTAASALLAQPSKILTGLAMVLGKCAVLHRGSPEDLAAYKEQAGEACHALANLVRYASPEEALASLASPETIAGVPLLSCLDDVANVMGAFAKDDHVMKFACECIKNAATKGEAVRELIMESNCTQAIVDVSRCHVAMLSATTGLSTGGSGSTSTSNVAMLSMAMNGRLRAFACKLRQCPPCTTWQQWSVCSIARPCRALSPCS